MIVTTDSRPTETPWWREWQVSRLLLQAASNGAMISNAVDHFGDDFAEASEVYGVDGVDWFLNIAFPLAARAHATVRFVSDYGHWTLTVDIAAIDPADLDQQMSTAYTVGLAAKLCRDLNQATIRRDGASGMTELSDVIEDLLGERGIRHAEFAATIGLTNNVFLSKLKGSTHWSAVDLLRITRALDPDRTAGLIDRLVDAVDAPKPARLLRGRAEVDEVLRALDFT